MGIFDDLKAKATNAAPAPAAALQNEQETFTFARLPESVDELKALPEAALTSPFQTAALTVCALCAYAAAPEIGIEMLNFLKGPQPLSTYDKQFLRDRFMDGRQYIPFSFFEGATPANDYTPNEPFCITVKANPYSACDSDRVTLYVHSGGADSDRQLTLRRKGDQYFLWEQHLLSGIRIPASQDPWA